MHLLHSSTLRLWTLCFAGFAMAACDEPSAIDAAGEKIERGSPGKADGVPSGWDCSASYYGTDDGCDCGCGVPDPDCAGVDSCDYEWCGPSPTPGAVFSQCAPDDDDDGGDGGDTHGGEEPGCPNDNSCRHFTSDGVCDDGGPESATSVCPIGTDFNDCGHRYGASCTDEGPIPVVHRAYVQKGDCNGSDGAQASLVVEGANFESQGRINGNLRGTKRRIDDQTPQPTWNTLTATTACSTYCCGPERFVGKTLSMISLGGDESNAVIIENAFP